MFYLLSWFVVFSLLALWSLAAWAFHALAVWAVSNAGALTGTTVGVGGLQLPAWLSPWVPPEIVQAVTALFSGLAPAVDGLLQSVPARGGRPERGDLDHLGQSAACCWCCWVLACTC